MIKQITTIIRSKEGENLVPFKALFILPDKTKRQNKHRLLPVFDSINQRLGKMIKGPPLSEIRFDRYSYENGSCTARTCSGIPIPDEFAEPCSGQPDNISNRVKIWNAGNYSVVVYVIIKNDTAPPNISCSTSEEAANAAYCDKYSKTKRPIRGIIQFCQQPSEMLNYELEALATHQLIHLLVRDLAGFHFPSSHCGTEEKCN